MDYSESLFADISSISAPTNRASFGPTICPHPWIDPCRNTIFLRVCLKEQNAEFVDRRASCATLRLR